MASLLMADSLLADKKYTEAEKILKNAFLYNKNSGKCVKLRKNHGAPWSNQRKITGPETRFAVLPKRMGTYQAHLRLNRVESIILASGWLPYCSNLKKYLNA